MSGRWRGRVVGLDEAPVAEAHVSIVTGTAPVPEIALVTDKNGRVDMGLPSGRFRLRAHAPDGTSGETEIEGESGDFVIKVGAQ